VQHPTKKADYSSLRLFILGRSAKLRKEQNCVSQFWGGLGRSDSKQAALRQLIADMFEKLEHHSYKGEIQSEKEYLAINRTIDLAEEWLKIMGEGPDDCGHDSLTRVYLSNALHSRVNYYRQQVTALTGSSFYTVRELATIVSAGQPTVKEYLRLMLVDIERMLNSEMEDTWADGWQEMWLTQRIMCYRALCEYGDAIHEADILVKLKGTHKSYMLLSECYRDFSHHHEAIKHATSALQYATNNIERHRAAQLRAGVHHEAGNESAAERDRLLAQSL
jgi:hypothetical protein